MDYSTTLVEVKVSAADYRADMKKPPRRCGKLRVYATAHDMGEIHLPDYWGHWIIHPDHVREVEAGFPFAAGVGCAERDASYELELFAAELSRLQRNRTDKAKGGSNVFHAWLACVAAVVERLTDTVGDEWVMLSDVVREAGRYKYGSALSAIDAIHHRWQSGTLLVGYTITTIGGKLAVRRD